MLLDFASVRNKVVARCVSCKISEFYAKNSLTVNAPLSINDICSLLTHISCMQNLYLKQVLLLISSNAQVCG